MPKKKTIIFIHQNYPGQYKHLAPLLAKSKKYNVHSLSLKNDTSEGVKHHKYTLVRGSTKGIHPLAQEFEAKVVRAESLSKYACKMKEQGINPDLVIAHPGWGESLFIKNVWPDTKLISYMEFFYYSSNSDVDFDKEFVYEQDFLANKLTARNSPILTDLLNSDKVVTPTHFQAKHAPEIFSNKIEVIHEGIDTKLLIKKDELNIKINQFQLNSKNKIVLYISRSLEPYRGYHSFIRSVPKILKQHPDAFILIVGHDGVSYGAPPPEGKGTYKDIFFKEVQDSISKELKNVFTERVLFLGTIKYEDLIKVIQISTVHVYLTYPFVLSWSLLESMSCESTVVASDTEPVLEVIENNKTGLLVNFFDYDGISDKVSSVLSNPEEFAEIGKNARNFIVENYDLEKISIPKYIKLIEDTING